MRRVFGLRRASAADVFGVFSGACRVALRCVAFFLFLFLFGGGYRWGGVGWGGWMSWYSISISMVTTYIHNTTVVSTVAVVVVVFFFFIFFFGVLCRVRTMEDCGVRRALLYCTCCHAYKYRRLQCSLLKDYCCRCCSFGPIFYRELVCCFLCSPSEQQQARSTV